MTALNNLYHRAIAVYGERAQLTKLAEECCECAAEVCRLDLDRSDVTRLAGEIADVEIMLDQARLIVGNDEVERARAEKLARLDRRVSREEARRGINSVPTDAAGENGHV